MNRASFATYGVLAIAVGLTGIAPAADAAVTIYIGGTVTTGNLPGDTQLTEAYTWSSGSLVKTQGQNQALVFDVAVGDYNNDGQLDVIQSRNNSGFIDGFSAGDLDVLPVTATSFQSTQRQIAVADLNGDGFDDVFGKSGTTLLSVFEGSAAGLGTNPGTSGEHNHFLTNSDYNNEAVAVTDFDGDGLRREILNGRADAFMGIWSYSGGFTNLGFLNQGNNVNAKSLLPGHFVSTTGGEDLIVVSNLNTAADDTVYWSNTNGGAAPYTDPVSLSDAASIVGTLLPSRREGVVGDFDNDGLDEVIIISDAGDVLRMFEFALVSGDVVPSVVQEITLANDGVTGAGLRLSADDLNNDGLDDLIVGTDDGTLVVYLSSGGALSFNASIGTGQTTLGGIAAIVPEPTSLGLIALGMTLILSPRRR